MIDEDDLPAEPWRPEPPDDELGVFQIEDFRSLRGNDPRKSPSIDWKTFLLWLALGLAAFWSFALLVVWLVIQLFADVRTGFPFGIPLAAIALFFVWIYFRMSSSHGR